MKQIKICHDRVVTGFEKIHVLAKLQPKSRQQLNDYYPNLTSCCSAKVNIKKVCSRCNIDVTTEEFNRKEFKLSKSQVFSIPTAQLEHIKQLLDDNTIKIKSFHPLSDIMLLAENCGKPYYLSQIKKYESEYCLYYEVLKNMRKCALGEVVLKSRPYPCIVFAHPSGYLELQPLHFCSEIYESPIIKDVPQNKEMVQLLAEIGNIHANQNQFHNCFETYINTRQLKEQELLALIIEGKELPHIPITPETLKVSVDDNELNRLKKLLAEAKK